MDINIKSLTFEALGNQIANGYPHDWTMLPIGYVAEMIEHGVYPETLTKAEALEAAEAVELWRSMSQ